MKKIKTIPCQIGLVTVDECKRVLGLDDREDGLTEWLIVAASATIEAYCMRRFTYSNRIEYIDFAGTESQALQEYPVRVVNSVQRIVNSGALFDVEYLLCPEEGVIVDRPYLLTISNGRLAMRNGGTVRVEYRAGYMVREMPLQLRQACVELVAWNYARYKDGKIGVTGSVKKGGERYETDMPENVKGLLERWRRKTI
jgi:hypothetical protein